MWGLDSEGQFIESGSSRSSSSSSSASIIDACRGMLLGSKGCWLIDADNESQHKIRSDLGHVARIVEDERYRLQAITPLISSHQENAKEMMISKRLLLLFQCDLLPEVSSMVLSTKDQRDHLCMRAIGRVTRRFAWLLYSLSIICLLAYMLIFASTQSDHRQNAWLGSFIVWMLIEMILNSTAIAILQHIWIPSMTIDDITEVKMAVIQYIKHFQKQHETEEDDDDGVVDTMERRVIQKHEFNSAQYMFTSTRLAKMYPDSFESKMIAAYSTNLPRHSRCYSSTKRDETSEADHAMTGIRQSLRVIMKPNQVFPCPTTESMHNNSNVLEHMEKGQSSLVNGSADARSLMKTTDRDDGRSVMKTVDSSSISDDTERFMETIAKRALPSTNTEEGDGGANDGEGMKPLALIQPRLYSTLIAVSELNRSSISSLYYLSDDDSSSDMDHDSRALTAEMKKDNVATAAAAAATAHRSMNSLSDDSLDQTSRDFFSNDILNTMDFQSPAIINLSMDTQQSIMQTNHAKDDDIGDNNRVVEVNKLGNTNMNRKSDDMPFQDAMIDDAYQSGLTQDKNDHHRFNKDDVRFNKDDDNRPASKVDVRSNDVVGFRQIKNSNYHSNVMPNQQSESESTSVLVSSQQLVFPDTLYTTTTKPTPTVMKYILILFACMPMFVQDLCIHMTSTCIVAGYIQLHIELYHLSKLLVIAPTALVAIVSHFIIIQSNKSEEAMKISQLLSSIDKNDNAKTPLEEGSSQVMSDESTNLLTMGIGGRDDRRASANHISIRLETIVSSSSDDDDDDNNDDDSFSGDDSDSGGDDDSGDVSIYHDDIEAQLDTRRRQFAMNPTTALYRLSSSGSSNSGSRESEVDNYRMLDVETYSNRWGNRADYARNGGFETLIIQDIDHDHHPPSSYHHHHRHNHNDHEGVKKSIVATSNLYVLSSSESDSGSHRDDKHD